MSTRYTIHHWPSGQAHMALYSGLGARIPLAEFQLVDNGAGFDVHDVDAEPNDMPVAVVPDLPAALRWAMENVLTGGTDDA